MRKMLQVIRIGLWAIPLLIIMALAVVCWRSYHRYNDFIAYESIVGPVRLHWSFSVIEKPGYLVASYIRSYDEWGSIPGFRIICKKQTGEDVDLGPASPEDRPWPIGVSYHREDSLVPGNGFGATPSPSTEWYFAVSDPLLALLLASPYTLLLLRRARQRRRRKLGQCVACGYDLRASPDRCPECGESVKPGSIAYSNAAHRPAEG